MRVFKQRNQNLHHQENVCLQSHLLKRLYTFSHNCYCLNPVGLWRWPLKTVMNHTTLCSQIQPFLV